MSHTINGIIVPIIHFASYDLRKDLMLKTYSLRISQMEVLPNYMFNFKSFKVNNIKDEKSLLTKWPVIVLIVDSDNQEKIVTINRLLNSIENNKVKDFFPKIIILSKDGEGKNYLDTTHVANLFELNEKNLVLLKSYVGEYLKEFIVLMSKEDLAKHFKPCENNLQKNEIKEWVSEGQLKKVIEYLSENLKSDNLRLNELILIKAKLNEIDGQKRQDIIKNDEYSIAKNKFIKSLLELIDMVN